MLVRLNKLLFGKFALFNRQAAALFAVINNPGQRMILIIQVRLIALPGRGVSVINFRAINLLERLHRANSAGKLKVAVIAEQIARAEEGQRR